MEGIEPSLNLVAEGRVSDLMDAVEMSCQAWNLDKSNPENVDNFKAAAHDLWLYLVSLKTVVKG